MTKISTDMPTSQSPISTIIPTEKRNLRDLVQNSAFTGGNYGSLAKSTIQPTFYIVHEVEFDDTLQRLALKYSVHIQEIKRVNKLWSDAELGLFKHIYIPVNKSQLTAFQTKYSTVHVVQDLPKLTNHHRTSSLNTNVTDETVSLVQSSDNSTSLSKINDSSYIDYLSKIDQQIQSTKQTLQSIDIIRKKYSKSESLEISTSDMSNSTCDTKPCKQDSTATCNNDRQTSIHRLSDSVLADLTTQHSREKYVSAALERIQREKDNFDDL